MHLCQYPGFKKSRGCAASGRDKRTPICVDISRISVIFSSLRNNLKK